MAKAKSKRNDRVKLIKKSNDLVEARYRFDIWEMRVFSKMITMIETKDRDFKDYKIYLKEFIKDYALEGDKNSYRHLREGAEKLMRKIVTIINKTGDVPMKFQTPVVAGLRTTLFDEEGKFIEVSFHPEMKPYLMELKTRFLVYDVRNILRLPSTYSIRIYELLKQYEKIGERKFDVKELKEILGISREYKMYGHFKSRVIDKAQADLAEFTDIQFSYEEIKDGKAVEKLVFTIQPNTPVRQAKSRKPKTESNSNTQLSMSFEAQETISEQIKPTVQKNKTIAQKQNKGVETIAYEEIRTPTNNADFFAKTLEKVSEWGITAEILQLLIETQSTEAIENGIAYTEREIKIGKIKDNAAGFFIKAVKNKFTSKAFEQEKKLQQKRYENEMRERQLVEARQLLVLLQDDYQARINEMIRQLTAQNAAVTEKAVEAVKAESQTYLQLKEWNSDALTVEDFRRDPILRALVIDKIKLQNAAYFEEIENVFRPQIQFYEKRIKELLLVQ